MNTAPPADELIEGLQAYAEEIDGIPTVRGMRSDGPHSPYYHKQEFGSWHEALQAAGIEPTHGVVPDVDREELLTELRQVQQVVERPPRRRDIEEYGEIPYELYTDEFSSFIYALEEAGITPDEKQYRFSSVETPEEYQGSENIEVLRENGPTPSNELPHGVSTNDRKLGSWKFHVSSGATHTADPIYYIDGEHAPELVLRRFFEHNPHVLEYRDPHGIKIAIRKHRPSWKNIGRQVVDELIETGGEPSPTFENLVLIRIPEEGALRYCFDQSVATQVDIQDLPLDIGDYTDTHPVWGFSEEHKKIWQELSKGDILLLRTKTGEITHYLPVLDTFENTDVMTELWVEYTGGIRSDGIERPWPYVILGTEVHQIKVNEKEFAAELGTELTGATVEYFDSEATAAISNKYGGFESYLRERERSKAHKPPGIDLEKVDSVQDAVEFLLSLSVDELPRDAAGSNLETIKRKVREEGFREGIYEIYPGCAICGRLLEAPDGSFELEAAHILPKAEDGPDVLQNGLGLCRRHHWAFDHDWFEISKEYKIRVREHPELEGYDEFQQYDGQLLRLPEEKELCPHPWYIRQRNERHDG